MKFITQLDDDIMFLSKLYEVAEKVNKFIDDTKILEIRKEKPNGLVTVAKLPDNFKTLSVEEQAEIMRDRSEKIDKNKSLMNEQLKKNVMNILGSVCKKHPEEFISLMHNLIVLDEGEDYPHGIDLMTTAIKVFTNKEMMGFFTELTVLGTLFTEK